MLGRREADINTGQEENIWNRRTSDQPSRFQHRCSFFTSVPRSVFFSSPRSMHVFCFVFALFKWINSLEQCSPAFFELYLRPLFFCVQLGHFLGQVTQSDFLTFFKKINKERERDLFSGIFILKSEFFLCCKKIYILISYLEYPVFNSQPP